MKYLALLIGLYFTLLAILPCQDQEDLLKEVTHVTFQKSHATTEQCNQETCPPFCNCSCCSSARQLTSKAVVSVFSETVISVYPSLTSLDTLSHAISIWQPPQLG